MRLLAFAAEVVLHPGRITIVHGHGCIVEWSQQILPHIPHLGGVLFQTHQDKPDMVAVQLHQLAFHHLKGLVIPGNTDHLPMATHGIHQKLLHLPQHILIFGIGLHQSIEAQFLRKIILIQGAVIFPFGFHSGARAGKEGISLRVGSLPNFV